MADSLEETAETELLTKDVIVIIKRSIKKAFGKNVDNYSSFHIDLAMDSLDRYELAYQVETLLDVEIPDEKLWDLNSVGDYVDYIQQYRREHPEQSS